MLLGSHAGACGIQECTRAFSPVGAGVMTLLL